MRLRCSSGVHTKAALLLLLTCSQENDAFGLLADPGEEVEADIAVWTVLMTDVSHGGTEAVVCFMRR